MYTVPSMIRSVVKGVADMNFYTTRNLVILALVQIIVITLGVLAAGTCWKGMTQFNMCGPLRELELICDFGWLALILPIVWVTFALWEFRRETEDDTRKVAHVLAGVLLLALLICGSWHYAIAPWVRLMRGCGGGLSE